MPSLHFLRVAELTQQEWVSLDYPIRTWFDPNPEKGWCAHQPDFDILSEGHVTAELAAEAVENRRHGLYLELYGKDATVVAPASARFSHVHRDDTPVRVHLTDKDAKLPLRATEGSGGYDLTSVETVILQPGSMHNFNTRVVFELPVGTVGMLRPRSSLAGKRGVTMISSGIIDWDYRGEVCVPLINHGKEPYRIEAGMRIAQVLLIQTQTPPLVLCEEDHGLSTTQRGAGGFGSTGK